MQRRLKRGPSAGPPVVEPMDSSRWQRGTTASCAATGNSRADLPAAQPSVPNAYCYGHYRCLLFRVRDARRRARSSAGNRTQCRRRPRLVPGALLYRVSPRPRACTHFRVPPSCRAQRGHACSAFGTACWGLAEIHPVALCTGAGSRAQRASKSCRCQSGRGGVGCGADALRYWLQRPHTSRILRRSACMSRCSAPCRSHNPQSFTRAQATTGAASQRSRMQALRE